MKQSSDEKLAQIKQQVEAHIERTEEQWREYWQQRWAGRFEHLSAKVKHGSSRGMSILNGLVGDYLAEKGLPIAVQMGFYDEGEEVELSPQALARVYPDATDKVCVLVHGLGCTEQVWDMDKPQDTYGSRLAASMGYTPLYVRYNSGLHISHNGQMLSQLMQQLLAAYPVKIKQLIFISHSMGGLVTRSACYYGSQQQQPWTDRVRQLYFLGSPHLGSDLEKFGNVVANVLKTTPLPYTRFVGELLDKRSAGIKDLRFGYVKDEDWQDQDPDELLSNRKETVPLLAGAEHYVITGTVHKDGDHILSQFFGDALVRKYSATGQSENDRHHLPFVAANLVELTNIRHLHLAHHERVYQQILSWISV